MTSFPDKERVVGTPISMTSYDEVLELLVDRPSDVATAVVICNVHSVMSARRDRRLARALSEADIATSDGMPLVWALRAFGHEEQQRVYGPTLLERALPFGIEHGWRHYFFGTTQPTLQKLRDSIEQRWPEAQIAGMHAPPFRPLTPAELDEVIDDVKHSGADLLWVGLGMPKQELWIHDVKARLPGVALLGVGAGFDFIAGTVKQAPSWMQDRGLEWLYRFGQEPRRLWRRYVFNNPAYLVLLGADLAKRRIRDR